MKAYVLSQERIPPLGKHYYPRHQKHQSQAMIERKKKVYEGHDLQKELNLRLKSIRDEKSTQVHSSRYTNKKNSQYTIIKTDRLGDNLQRHHSLAEYPHKKRKSSVSNPEQESFINIISLNQYHFLLLCQKKQYEEASEVLINILNYTIDIKNIRYFFIVLWKLGKFYFLVKQPQLAIKYFEELFNGALLQKNYYFLVKSLISISYCCEQESLYQEAVKVLKKALEYAWYGGNQELQLKIYDQLGKNYFKLGQLEKAKGYHNKYLNTEVQSIDSPLKLLASKRIHANQHDFLEQNVRGICIIFLVHLFVPIKNTETLPMLENSQQSDSLRDKVKIKEPKQKLENPYIDSIEYQVKKLFKHWIFAEETEEPGICAQTKTNFKFKKSPHYKFQLNNHLKELGLKPLRKVKQEIKKDLRNFQHKESLEEKIKKKINQPPLTKDWFQKITESVLKNRKKNRNNLKSPIQISRDFSHKSLVEKLKHFYSTLLFID